MHPRIELGMLSSQWIDKFRSTIDSDRFTTDKSTIAFAVCPVLFGIVRIVREEIQEDVRD